MDDIGFWILGYALETLFTYWVYKKRGAERLEGTFASGFFIHFLAPRWSAEGIKAFVGIGWVLMTIFFVIGDVLAIDRQQDVVEHRLNQGVEEVCIILHKIRQKKAEAVPELLRGGPEAGVEVVGGQSVHRQGMDDPYGSGLILLLWKCLLNPVFKLAAFIFDQLDVSFELEGGIVSQLLPVVVIGD